MNKEDQRKVFEKHMTGSSHRAFMDKIMNDTQQIKTKYIRFEVQASLLRLMTSDDYIDLQVDIAKWVTGKTPEQIAQKVAHMTLATASNLMIEESKDQF